MSLKSSCVAEIVREVKTGREKITWLISTDRRTEFCVHTLPDHNPNAKIKGLYLTHVSSRRMPAPCPTEDKAALRWYFRDLGRERATPPRLSRGAATGMAVHDATVGKIQRGDFTP